MTTEVLAKSPVAADEFAEQWQAWHRSHETRRADPHGFLAITGIHWLGPEPQRFTDAPGTWTATDDDITVVLDDGDELVIDGVTVRGEHSFGAIAERASVHARWQAAVIEVARRGGYAIVRPRHPDNPVLAAYRGTPAYEPDPRWAVTGRYVPFAEPRPTTVGSVVDELHHVYPALGRVDFAVDGQPLSLTVFEGYTPGSLTILFTDATSGVTTYAANRSLQLGPPDEDGTVTVDFNRATNLPCAYTDHATCPLPPAENRLAVAVEAGERYPYETAV
ncbi:uncharacterized protein (DUF1684 family) [Allocatelliglobosispora scoriae]|uniref:Uncharacterized protein (DUF1684 family) n=1 Tax=Allocatelliglobosispora scoriae TaxID=643052 RepID=A0A841C673_9ACTN|nr:DUF1684 domain-containing protein [Allocatelliglobosispora scoriae]MBB5874582.1 uncharacterized protein (DUF1684 family) [Allocatelliglobosispora scoriae]